MREARESALHFILNLRTAAAPGLTVPEPLLLRADEVIRRSRRLPAPDCAPLERVSMRNPRTPTRLRTFIRTPTFQSA
jgi:hypothetical protein